MEDADLRLDGNAIGGLLHDIFACEMTAATSICTACQDVAEVGALLVYAHGPGVVVRCPRCGGVLMRVVQRRGRYLLDLRGFRSLEFRESG